MAKTRARRSNGASSGNALAGLKFSVLLSAALLTALVAGPGLAHKYYVALTRIDFNARTATLEVVHRFFADDLEVALGRRAGHAVSISDLRDAEAVAGPLIARSFVIAADGAPVTLAFLGIEVDGDFAWAYFEAPAFAPPARLTITNRLLFADFPDQVNTVTATIRGRRRSANFDRATDRGELVFAAGPN